MTAPVKMLKDVGARLIRSTHHDVWELPNHRKVVLAKTASDHRAVKNQIRDIKRQLRAGEL